MSGSKLPGAAKLDEVLFEFIQQGAYIKVCAVDPKSGIEISIVGDPKAGQETLQRIAINKLAYVINKRLKDAAPKPPLPRDDNLY